jgi:hypothetical protein
MIRRYFNFIFLWLLVGLACTPLTQLSSQLPQVTATPVEVDLPSPTAPVAPTPAPSLTPSPAATATLVEAPAMPTPEVDFTDLSPYHQAMLADFTGDVDTVAAAGASHYYLEASVEPSNRPEGLRISGVERILYTNTEEVPLTDIYIHLYPNLPSYGGQMAVEMMIIDGQPVSPVVETDDSVLRASLPGPLPPGEMADISLSYEALVPPGRQSGYNIFSYNNGTAALAGFFPVIAVYDEQGWATAAPPPHGDATYLDTALFQVELSVPQEMVVAASGSLLESISNDDAGVTLRFASGPIRDFYVVMRQDYQRLSEQVGGIQVNSYYPPGLEEGGRLALRYAVDALKVFNERFGPYPYAEFDVAATPTTAGGVEYPGIVVVTEQVYHQEGGFFEHATVHEVAHQWWYSMVGNDQVKEPWLDESLTNYSTVIYWEEIRGEDAANSVVNAFFVDPYERAKEQGRDRAVIGPVSDFSQGEYGAFVYGKGPLFFHALRQEVGDETYFEIMQRYYEQYKYEIATSEDLLQTIEQVSGQDIAPLYETWLEAP